MSERSSAPSGAARDPVTGRDLDPRARRLGDDGHRGDAAGHLGDGAHHPTLTAEDLDRERLASYVTWGEQATPRWYFPTYGVLLAAWIASFDLGPTWVRVAATLVYVAALGAMVSAATTATGVSMPRLRGMPRRLRWACLAPVGLLVLALLGVFGWFELTDPEVSALLVGVVVGPAVALGGALATHGYRVVARRLADEAGLPR